jgi:toxin ParE1/3/4
MRIVTTVSAQHDIYEIYQYYLHKVNQKIAKQEQTKIVQRIKILKDFPLIGQVEDNEKFQGAGFRYLVQGNFKILYKIEEDDIVILSVFHTMQHPDKMSI